MGKKLLAVCLAVVIALFAAPVTAFGTPTPAAPSSLVQTAQELEPLIGFIDRLTGDSLAVLRPVDADLQQHIRSFTDFFKDCWNSFLSFFKKPKDEQKKEPAASDPLDCIGTLLYACDENAQGVITIPTGIVTIGEAAFLNCSRVTGVIIPNTVQTIGQNAFFGCSSLTAITIPNSVVTVGDGAFTGCSSLTDVTVSDKVRTLPDNAFTDCPIKHIVTGNGLQAIPSTMINQQTLESIVIGSSITSIDDHMFASCANLSDVTITGQLESIGDSAFYNCKSLARINVPNSTKSIGNGAFYGCTDLVNIIISDDVETIGEQAFYNTGFYNDESNWDNGVLYIAKRLIKARTTLSKTYIIKANTTSIDGGAFANCEKLEQIVIPDGLKRIGNHAFFGCVGLTDINIPSSVNSIEHSAFANCKNLTSIVLPQGITCVGYHLFYGCENLEQVEIPNGVTVIGECAFYRCTALKSIVIPDSVKAIEHDAFLNCYSLESVTLPGGIETIGDFAFYGCKRVRSMTVPASLVGMGHGVFTGWTNAQTIVIGAGANTASWNAEWNKDCSAKIETQ